MFTVNDYVVAESLEQAYELNQNRRNAVLGGIMWMKMGRKRIGKAIDLTALGLNKIEESETSFRLGCMCTLREVETNRALNSYFDGIIQKSIGNIVGVQLRNGATIGGTVFSRFGFSDVLTALLSLDTYVELYRGGIVSLSDFVNMPCDKDILVSVIIKKDKRRASYMSHRTSSGDLPVITCASSFIDDRWNIVVGARPMKARLIALNGTLDISDEKVNEMTETIKRLLEWGTNMRGSKQYRQHLAGVLIKRNIKSVQNVGGGCYED